MRPRVGSRRGARDLVHVPEVSGAAPPYPRLDYGVPRRVDNSRSGLASLGAIVERSRVAHNWRMILWTNDGRR